MEVGVILAKNMLARVSTHLDNMAIGARASDCASSCQLLHLRKDGYNGYLHYDPSSVLTHAPEARNSAMLNKAKLLMDGFTEVMLSLIAIILTRHPQEGSPQRAGRLLWRPVQQSRADGFPPPRQEHMYDATIHMESLR